VLQHLRDGVHTGHIPECLPPHPARQRAQDHGRLRLVVYGGDAEMVPVLAEDIIADLPEELKGLYLNLPCSSSRLRLPDNSTACQWADVEQLIRNVNLYTYHTFKYSSPKIRTCLRISIQTVSQYSPIQRRVRIRDPVLRCLDPGSRIREEHKFSNSRQGTDSDTSRFSNTSRGGVRIRILQHARIPNKRMKEQSPDMNPYITLTSGSGPKTNTLGSGSGFPTQTAEQGNHPNGTCTKTCASGSGCGMKILGSGSGPAPPTTGKTIHPSGSGPNTRPDPETKISRIGIQTLSAHSRTN
jgi:hypothetical protein